MKITSARTFIETAAFTRIIKRGQISDEMLNDLQADIVKGMGNTIPNSGGFKKIRFSAETTGKSGGWRAIFADYPKYNITVLVLAYPKNAQADLTAEQVKELRKLKLATNKELERRYGKKKKTKR